MRAVVLVLLCLGAVGCLVELNNWALSTEDNWVNEAATVTEGSATASADNAVEKGINPKS